MADGTTNNSKVYIGPASNGETASSAYSALSWTEVKGLDSIPNIGGKDSIISYSTLDDNKVNKKKGTTDYGSGDLIVIDRDDDAGQAALKSANLSTFPYCFKIVPPNAQSESGTDAVLYFHALVASNQPQYGAANQVVKRTFGLEVVDAPVYVAAT